MILYLNSYDSVDAGVTRRNKEKFRTAWRYMKAFKSFTFFLIVCVLSVEFDDIK